MKNFLMIIGILCFGLNSLFAQTVQVSGTVVSAEDNQPLPGVSVVVKGTTHGTITDVDGKYSFGVPQNSILLFSFIGMETQEIELGARRVIDVSLNMETTELSEIVVTAIGISKAEKTVGFATTTVKSDEITSAMSGSLMSGLTGKVAGVNISNAGGTGTSQKVIVRGFASLTGSNQPLYVVDGVPIENRFQGVDDFADAYKDAVDFGNQANDINPDDVESVTVLKGASATALYGSRAANGVIMVTTKRAKGSENKLVVNYDGSAMASNVLRVPQTQDMFGQGWPYWDPAENGSWGPKLDGRDHVWGPYSAHEGDIPPLLDPLSKPFSYVKDNVRNYYKTGLELNNSISVRVGNQDLGLVVSYGNTMSNGVLPNDADKFNRNTFSLRGNAKYKRFSTDVNINYVRKDISQAAAGQGNDGATMFQEIIQNPVDIDISSMKDWNNPYYDTDAYYTWYAQNPYWVVDNNKNKYQDDRVYGKLELSFELDKHWKAVGRMGGDFTNSRQKRWNQKVDYTPGSWSDGGGKSPLAGTFKERTDNIGQIDATVFVNGQYNLGTNFTFNGVLGWNMNQRTSSYLSSYLYGLAEPSWYSLLNGSDKPVPESLTERRRLIGLFAQADFGYKDYLFLTLTARNDWSSTLPIDDNSFFYGGVNAAWILTDWMKDMKGDIVNFLKLRAAWGKTGNDAMPYRLRTTYRPTQISLGFGDMYLPMAGVLGLTLSDRLGNMKLKPEITAEWEFGISGRFFNNRVITDIAYYNKTTENQIIAASMAPESDYTTQTLNVGKISNEGVEVLLSVIPVQVNGFEWEIGATFAKNWSEVKKLWGEGDDETTEYRIGNAYQVDFVAEKGQPLGVFKVPAPEIVADGPYAGYTVVNAQGRPMIDANKKETVGTSNPDFTMGFNTRLSYKGISLSALVDWRKGSYFYSYTAQLMYFNGNATQTVYNERQPFLVPNSVKVINGNYVENDIPTTWSGTYTYYNNASNFAQFKNWVLPKDYVKLREVVLTYTLPSRLFDNIFISGIEVSVIGRNLLMWTPKANNFVDPEATNYGNDLFSEIGEFAGAPTSRTFGGRLKIVF